MKSILLGMIFGILLCIFIALIIDTFVCNFSYDKNKNKLTMIYKKNSKLYRARLKALVIDKRNDLLSKYDTASDIHFSIDTCVKIANLYKERYIAYFKSLNLVMVAIDYLKKCDYPDEYELEVKNFIVMLKIVHDSIYSDNDNITMTFIKNKRYLDYALEEGINRMMDLYVKDFCHSTSLLMNYDKTTIETLDYSLEKFFYSHPEIKDRFDEIKNDMVSDTDDYIKDSYERLFPNGRFEQKNNVLNSRVMAIRYELDSIIGADYPVSTLKSMINDTQLDETFKNDVESIILYFNGRTLEVLNALNAMCMSHVAKDNMNHGYVNNPKLNFYYDQDRIYSGENISFDRNNKAVQEVLNEYHKKYYSNCIHELMVIERKIEKKNEKYN